MAANAQEAAPNNVSPGTSSQAGQGPPDPRLTLEPLTSNESKGITSVVLLTGGITLLMYFQIVGFYKYFHKRHPRIFKKPKLPPFEVMRERLLKSKVVNKLKELGSQSQGDGVKPAANVPANYSGQVNQGYEDENNQEPNYRDGENQQRSVYSRASTAPRFRTARRPNWTERARRVNQQMRE